MLSGFDIDDVLIVSVLAGVLCIVLSVAVVTESELFIDVEDSLVPQLTVTSPRATAVNINFFIILYFLVRSMGISIIIPKMVNISFINYYTNYVYTMV